MMHDLVALLPTWGPWIIALSAFLSCVMLPVPSTALLLTAGALTGTGHLPLPQIALAAALGGTLGDLTAYTLARRLEPRLKRPGTKRAALLDRAQGYLARRGILAVFLSRWLVTPLGPPMNYVAGLSELPLARFAAASLAGETLWALTQLGAGHLFGRQFREAESAASKAIAVGLVLAAVVYLARLLWRRFEAHHA